MSRLTNVSRRQLSNILRHFGSISSLRFSNPMGDNQNKTPRNSGRIFKTCKWGMIQGGTKTVLEKFKLCKDVGFDGIELINPVNFGEPAAESAPENNDPKVAEIV